MDKGKNGGASGQQEGYYEDFRDMMKTFDIVLWSGASQLSSWIKKFTGSNWSHVGMVVRDPLNDLVLLWESTISEGKSGVRISNLSDSVKEGGFAWRPVHADVSRFSITVLEEKLIQARKLLDGRPFEKNLLEFINAGYDGPFGRNTRDITTIFCAELVAETWQMCGLLPTDKSSNEYTPSDFSTERELVTSEGVVIGNEMYLKPKAKPAAVAAGIQLKEVKGNFRGVTFK